ncbi:MAG: recombinase family protein, partial [Burkholderiaceae bacterium]
KLYHRYQDDGVSGSVPLADRPSGRRLIEDAMAGRFHVLLVTRADRLGRDVIDLMQGRALFERLGVEIVGVLEPMDDEFGFDMLAVMAKHERKRLLKRSAEGMNRAAREGRYTGGIVPLGYKLEERNKHFYYVLSDTPMWNDLTEADVARRVFERLALDRSSCTQIALEFHALGIPTVYQKDRRGIRGRATQALWRPNRIYCLATNTIYRGELRYGRHTKRPGGREIISAQVPRLVSDEIWYAAQESLHANRLNLSGKTTIYLLRSLMNCDLCGRRYSGASSPGRKPVYRCGGQLSKRPGFERCPGKAVRCEAIDDPVRADIERFLRDPGEILNELADEASKAGSANAVAEAEKTLYEATLIPHLIPSRSSCVSVWSMPGNKADSTQSADSYSSRNSLRSSA